MDWLRIGLTCVAGGILSGVLGLLLLPLLRALKAGQSVHTIGPTWHNKKVGTPLMGGLMFIGAVVICLLGSLFTIEKYTVFFALGLAMCFGIVGFLDDFFKVKFKRDLGLTAFQKMALQMAVSAIYLYILYRQGVMSSNLYIPFVNVEFYIHPIIYIFFAMFVMVGTVNAVNLTDGVDGLCATVTLPVMAFFTVVACCKGMWDLALLPASLFGALIAYLFFNWHPAKVFMGDTGSLFLGGVVTALAFALEMPLILILVGFIYMMEVVSDLIQFAYFRATGGKRFFKMAPIHHHFEKCGWKEVKIVLVFSAVSTLMCLIAWFGVQGWLPK
ncbi:MAG: phospho-N-acetylmuramoyl-pentapeptide-transferase [Oscillospiraceae bacterium]|nr:phospho-N-acetylmuramoyl-pentapeptide-transferase [Oscillospiraceae bacterium]